MTFNYNTQLPQNWQSSLTVNISRSTVIQHIYCVPYTSLPLLLVVGLAPFQLSLTYRTQQCNRTRVKRSTSRKSWRYNFGCKALQSRELTRLRSWLLGGKFLLLLWTLVHRKQATRVLWIVVLITVSFRCTCASKIKNTVLTQDKVLHVLIYGLLRSDQIQYVGERVKWS